LTIGYSGQNDLHWNYFLALEGDLFTLARYVEFVPDNMGTYSLELARILLATASEVDVVAKLLARSLDRASRAETIDGYKAVIKQNFPHISGFKVFMPRYGLDFTPWENWRGDENPDWWRANNKVKHERDANFSRANLTNVLNALSGLILLLIVYAKVRGIQEFRPAPHLLIPDARLAIMNVGTEGTILSFT
jgi:hypothetical protein